MAQTSYLKNPVLGIAGGIADSGSLGHIESKASEEAAAFPFGVAVVAGTDPDVQVLLPTAAAKIEGVAVHEHIAPVVDANGALVQPDKMLGVMNVGRIFVLVEDAVTPASSVFVRIATGAGGSQKGAFRSDADTATALAASGMRFVSSAAAGGIAILEIDADAAIA